MRSIVCTQEEKAGKESVAAEMQACMQEAAKCERNVRIEAKAEKEPQKM